MMSFYKSSNRTTSEKDREGSGLGRHPNYSKPGAPGGLHVARPMIASWYGSSALLPRQSGRNRQSPVVGRDPPAGLCRRGARRTAGGSGGGGAGPNIPRPGGNAEKHMRASRRRAASGGWPLHVRTKPPWDAPCPFLFVACGRTARCRCPSPGGAGTAARRGANARGGACSKPARGGGPR